MTAILKAFVLLVAVAAVVLVALFIWIDSRGISAKAQPGRVETAVARTMRRLAIPRDARDRQNPVMRSPEVIAEGMAHYADHCAACHGNDGSGETEIGLGLYPKAPDMRLATTQSLSDGELFYIIENGVRLTGMPAWSTGHADGEKSTWRLVHFIRELPKLTPEKIDEMKRLNPRSPAEIQQETEEERFLRGDDTPSPRTTTHEHTGAHK
jgi:mono/diheme cytochrome c family protein